MKYLQLLILPIAVLLAQGASASVVVAADSFATTGNIVGKTGGTGWDGAWGGVSPTATVTANGLRFTGNSTAAATRTLANTQTGSILVDFTMSFTGALERNDFVAFWFDSSNGANIGLKGNCDALACTDDVFVRNTNTSTMMLPSSALSANTTYHIFGHFYKSTASSNYNRFDAWLNPTAAEMLYLTGADSHSTTTASFSSFDRVGFRSANLNNGVAVTIDNLRLQAIPEPGSFALMGLAMLGLGLTLRRK
jgi:hypothetical protein